MSSVPYLSLLMLVAQSISVLSVLIDPPESSMLSDTSRLITSTDSKHASEFVSISELNTPCGLLQYPIDDCLGLSLEYLGNGTDILNFRRTSNHFDRIYDQYRIHQNTRFRDFGMLFQNASQQNKYRSIDDVLHSIPLIPDVYIASTESDLKGLYNLHYRSRTNVLRGLQ